MKALVVCEEDVSYAAAIAHLLFVGISTLAITNKFFKNVEVKVIGKTEGWSPFCMSFFGECSYYKEFTSVDSKKNILAVVSYSLCRPAKLLSVGLTNYTSSVLSLPLLASVVRTDGSDSSRFESEKIKDALVHAHEIENHRQEFNSMEDEQIFLADCIYNFLAVIERVASED